MGEAKKEEVKEAKKEEVKESKEDKKDKKKEVKDKVEDVKMEDAKEKKRRKKKPKRTSSRFGRVRKQVKQYVCAAAPEEKELEVPDGIGIPLGEISNVTTRMGPIRSEDPILR